MKTRMWDLPAAALLLTLILTAVGRLGVTRWVPGLEHVQTLAVISTLLGLALGLSAFGRRAVTALALGYSLVVVPLMLARFMDLELALETRLLSIGGRLLYSIGEFSGGRPVEDPLFLAAFLALLFWALGLIAGYMLLRKANYLVAVFPSGLVMLIVQAYDPYPPSRVWFLAFYLFLALLLLGRIHYLRSQNEWRRNNVFVTPETGLDMTGGAALAAALIVLASWVFPGVAGSPMAARLWERATEPWRDVRERLSDAFAAVKSGASGGAELFGEQMSLGTGTLLGDQAVFHVHLSTAKSVAPRYYWRGRVYDRYENGQWLSTAEPFQAFNPQGDALLDPVSSLYPVEEFTFTLFIRQRTLYLPSQPLWIDRRANFRPLTLPNQGRETVYARALSSMEPGEVYQARSVLIIPTVAQLRAADVQYPPDLVERYLQLPQGFSPRIQALARQITKDAGTPYDKADAITTYLRREIRYSAVIPAPPPGKDPLEYVLFDLKRGFCNYYAGAEVLMLRSVGVPARLAVGFAEGKPDVGRRNFTVLQRDAHAWPEVYFPGIGWVEFEPTANQDVIVRPSGLERADEQGRLRRPRRDLADEEEGGNLLPGGLNAENTAAGVADESSPDLWLILRRGILPTLALILLFVSWHINRRYAFLEQAPGRLIVVLEERRAPIPDWLRKWDMYNRAGVLGRAFEMVNLSLRCLGEPPPPHATPAQRARVLIELMPAAAESIRALSEEYQVGLYSPYPANASRARRAAAKLVPHLLRAMLQRFLISIQDRL